MIDNFNKFKRNFKEWEFYFIQLIKRKKDNSDVSWINWNNHMRCIKDYSIYTEEQLNKYKQEMIDISEITNSRIYIHPARRSKEKISKEMLRLIVENVTDWKNNLSWIYRSACWHKTYTEKLRIVDIDNDIYEMWEKDFIFKMENFINSLEPKWNKIHMKLQTLNWFHLITKPFNLLQFKEVFRLNIDIHKNNPTLLYFNNKND